MSSLTEKAKKWTEELKQKAKEATEHVAPNFVPEVNKIKGGDKLYIVAVLPKGGPAIKDNPRYLHCVEHALGLTNWARSHGATLVVTDDGARDKGEFDKQLPDADVIITSPYYPAYITRERLDKAKKLQLIINLPGGSDHIDLQAAADKKATVVVLSGPHADSVAEDEIMRTLIILRNFIKGHDQSTGGQWDVVAATADSYDLKDKVIGTVGAGKVGRALLKRLTKHWDTKELLYHDKEQKEHLDHWGVKYVGDLDDFLSKCDVVVINVPLDGKTKGLFNERTISKMKKGSVLINDSCAAIVDTQAVVKASESGHLKGYGGDTWPSDLVPKDHPWRTMPRNAMTPHMAGLTLDAQENYSEQARLVLSRFSTKEELPKKDWYLVKEGKILKEWE